MQPAYMRLEIQETALRSFPIRCTGSAVVQRNVRRHIFTSHGMVAGEVLEYRRHILRVVEQEGGQADRDDLDVQLLHRFYDVLRALAQRRRGGQLVPGPQHDHHRTDVLDGVINVVVLQDVPFDDFHAVSQVIGQFGWVTNEGPHVQTYVAGEISISSLS